VEEEEDELLIIEASLASAEVSAGSVAKADQNQLKFSHDDKKFCETHYRCEREIDLASMEEQVIKSYKQYTSTQYQVLSNK
jgi:hypothetical protein